MRRRFPIACLVVTMAIACGPERRSSGRGGGGGGGSAEGEGEGEGPAEGEGEGAAEGEGVQECPDGHEWADGECHPSQGANEGEGEGGGRGEAGMHERTADIGGVERSYTIWAPQQALDKAAPVPLLFVYHGGADSAANILAVTRATDAAAFRGWIVAAPQGDHGQWFTSTDEGWAAGDGQGDSMINDAALTKHIFEEITAEYDVDTEKVYAMGYSRGGAMVVLLATGSGNPSLFGGFWNSFFKGYGISAGYDPISGNQGYATATPKAPMIVHHGTADGVVDIAMAQTMVDGLQEAGWTVEFTTHDGGHDWFFDTAALLIDWE